jgi:hypothetical protein
VIFTLILHHFPFPASVRSPAAFSPMTLRAFRCTRFGFLPELFPVNSRHFYHDLSTVKASIRLSLSPPAEPEHRRRLIIQKPCRCCRAGAPVLARVPPTETLLPAATPSFLWRRRTLLVSVPLLPPVQHARAREIPAKAGKHPHRVHARRWPRVHVPRPAQTRVLLSTSKPSSLHASAAASDCGSASIRSTGAAYAIWAGAIHR